MQNESRMKISLLALIVFLLAMPGVILRTAAQEGTQDSPSAVAAKQIIQELVAGQFEKVEAIYDARMAQALPPGKLADGWRDLNKQAGAFQAISSTETSQVQGLQVVKLQCKFENSLLDATVVFNPDGKLGGLSFRPHQAPAAPWTPPAYAKQDSFSEQPLTLVNGKYELPGTLTVPVGNGPFPAVVLVQGSGPEDQDETIGPNKPFKDLAWGLASRGIVVFRYTKRTEKYTVQSSDDPMHMTVEDETISDARAAVALVAKQPKVDPKQVFLLGHSSGRVPGAADRDGRRGNCGNRYAGGERASAGKMVLEQIHNLAAMSGTPTEAEQKRIEAIESSAKQIESPGLKPDDKIEFLGATMYGAYWLDLRAYDPLENGGQAEDSDLDRARWAGLSGDAFEFSGVVGCAVE